MAAARRRDARRRISVEGADVVPDSSTSPRMWMQAMVTAREKGATMEDIGEALGLTTQAIYHRFRNSRDGDHPIARGRPRKVSS